MAFFGPTAVSSTDDLLAILSAMTPAEHTMWASADGDGTVLTACTFNPVSRTYAGTIKTWQIMADVSGSVTFSVTKYSWADYLAGNSGTVLGTCVLSSARAATGTVDWDFDATDVIVVSITGTPVSVTKATLELHNTEQ